MIVGFVDRASVSPSARTTSRSIGHANPKIKANRQITGFGRNDISNSPSGYRPASVPFVSNDRTYSDCHLFSI